MNMKQRLARKHYERGRQYELQEQIEAALEIYHKACALEPEFPEPYFALARLEANRSHYEAALPYFGLALDLKRDPEVLEWRAFVLGRLQRYEEALMDYREVYEETNDSQVQVNLGRMYLALRRYDEALDVLKDSEDASAKALLEALPLYREFELGEPLDNHRSVRYLFGRTILLGTLGEGLGESRYLLLSLRHIALSLSRLERLYLRCGWRFDGVAAQGPHHAPLARALAELLSLPWVEHPGSEQRLLLCSAVLKGLKEVRAVERPWRVAGAKILHFCMGFIPNGEVDPKEPEIIGFLGRSAVEWYRVESFSRMIQPENLKENWPDLQLGPAFINPNTEQVAEALIKACRETRDPYGETVIRYYTQRHSRTRAFEWEGG